jgi:hypothetical protein
MKLPYIKWYFRDAAADLRLLDSSPRCVWYEMLWIMAASDRYGYLERQGRPMTDEELSRSCGLPVAEIAAARPVLLADGIPSIEPETGIWFCRRMVDDDHRRSALSEAGKRGGGNPLLASSPLATDAASEPRTQNPSKCKGPFKGTFKGGFKGAETFDAFWEAYPRKVGKEAARKAWPKAADNLPAIIEALSWQRVSESWTKDGGTFIPHPATYLNGHRWEDEKPAPYTPARTPQKSPSNAAHGSDPSQYERLVIRSPKND